MKIFVTGGSGLIGRHLIARLAACGHQLTVLRRRAGADFGGLEKVDWISAELDEVNLSDLEGIDTLIHLAAAGVNPGDQTSCFETNVTKSGQLMKTAIKAGVGHLIVCGSCFEYGRSAENQDKVSVTSPLLPIGLYSGSKAAASALAISLCQESQTPLSLLRPFHVFGEGEGPYRFWPSLKKAALAGEDFPMSKGEQVRDFTPVELIADQILAECAAPYPGITIKNLGTGKATQLIEFAKEWWQRFQAAGELRPGALPYRSQEVMRFVPDLTPFQISFRSPS